MVVQAAAQFRLYPSAGPMDEEAPSQATHGDHHRRAEHRHHKHADTTHRAVALHEDIDGASHKLWNEQLCAAGDHERQDPGHVVPSVPFDQR